MIRRNLLSLTKTQLKKEFDLMKWPSYRAVQLFKLLYKSMNTDIKSYKLFPKNDIKQLEELFYIDYGTVQVQLKYN
jgi:adenine C2-methylase RlmN of 23S rRNA A2503 and tRNA A37